MTYEAFVGLTLNSVMGRMRKAYTMFLAHSAARTTGDLDAEWFEAATESPAEASGLRFRTNARRAAANFRGR